MSQQSPNSSSPRIAILGGGISGLTAAYRLTQLLPSAQLELFEASDRLGGMLHTRHTDELLMECGADSFIDKLPAAVELCHELGLGDEIIPTNNEHRRALILFGGKLHPVPQGFVQMRPEKITPMLLTKLLSWRGKLRLLAERFIAPRAKSTEPSADETVASFFTRRLGREVFERLVQPLLAGIYTADPYKLSVAATMPTAIEAEQKHGSLLAAVLAARAQQKASPQDSGARYASFVTLRGGLDQLISTLQSQLDNAKIHFNTPIASVTPTADHRWTVSPVDGADPLPVDPAPFDHVVVALPAPRAAEVLSAADPKLSASLSSIPYAGSAVAVLVYRRDQIRDPLDGFGVVIPTVEGRKIVAASFSSVKFPGRAPVDQVLVRVFVGGALQPELLELSDDAIARLAQDELSDILGIEGQPLRAELVRWNEKMPQYHVGHQQLIEQIETQLATHQGIALAGNAYHGVGIPQCVQSGEKAAQSIANFATKTD